MRNQGLINDDKYSYRGVLSQNRIIPSSGSSVASESDSFQQHWSVPRITGNSSEVVYKVAFGEGTPEWVENIRIKLNELLNLPDDWDSYGAKKVDVNSTIFVFELLTTLIERDVPEPSIVPTVEGGIQLEWHIKDINFEVEINPDRNTSYYFEDKRKEHELLEDEFVFYRSNLPESFIHCLDVFIDSLSER